MKKVTLGGERLGTGKKMQVELHNYERSTHDLSYVWRSSMSVGTLVPFMVEVGLPGDTFDINLDAYVNTLPTLGPLFGSMKLQLDIFQAPIRLYNSLLHNNALGIGLDMSKVKLPQVKLTATTMANSEDKDNSQINPSSLLAYLGYRGVGYSANEAERLFNGTAILAYWEIYKNYYSNKQEGIGAFIHGGFGAYTDNITSFTITDNGTTWNLERNAPSPMNDLTPTALFKVEYTGGAGAFNPKRIMVVLAGTGAISLDQLLVNTVDDGTEYRGFYDFSRYGLTYAEYWEGYNYNGPVTVEPRVTTFDLKNIDQMRKEILKFDSESVPFILNEDVSIVPYSLLDAKSSDIANKLLSQEGLALKTYLSDIYNNWLETESIEAINDASAVSVVSGSFTIDQLNLSQKVYELLNRIAVSGGTYDDWLDSVYMHERIKRAESPIYHGGLIREIVFQEVVSNAETAQQPLGQLAGKGTLSGSKKGGTVIVKVDEPSYIIGIVSITPRIDYSQGNNWQTGLETMNDLHMPGMDQIGFQDLITEQMAWWSTYWDGTKWVQRSAGKQPAWINYMTNYNRTHGNFAIPSKEMFMTLNRRYEWDNNTANIKDLTTYIDPSKFNFIFAQNSLDAQNYWVQIGCDITARRKMSAKIMPNI